jgi:Trk K+ transport system NAD-binding subunit
VTVVGLWECGKLVAPLPDTPLNQHTVLILAGSGEQLASFEVFAARKEKNRCPVVILGGGRVGRAAGRVLAERGVDYRIVERNPERIRNKQHYVLGNAAELEVLTKAGVMEAPTVLVTTHDDDTNVYLTIYCRRLRPEMQVLSRATLERNVSTLYRAGADLVLSYATMGASAIFNHLHENRVQTIAEGLSLLRLVVPESLVGRTLKEARIREQTGCSVVAVKTGSECDVNPDPERPLPASAELLMIGGLEGEESFLTHFGNGDES